MNRKSHQDKDIIEADTENAKNSSRRGFLAGGAAAFVGTAVAAVAPKQVEAHKAGADHVTHETVPGVYLKAPSATNPHGPMIPVVTYHPNEGLVSVIVRAWKNEKFHAKLLSYDSDADAGDGTSAKKPNHARTQRRLGKVGNVHLDRPVVITEKAYKDGYIMRNNNEVVFVIPDKPDQVIDDAGSETGATARALMAAVPFGM